MTITITPAQARAVLQLAEDKGKISLHQLAHGAGGPAADDVFVTPATTAAGFRVTPEGEVSEIGETLPAAS